MAESVNSTRWMRTAMPCRDCGEFSNFGVWEQDRWVCLDCQDRDLSDYAKTVLREIDG